MFKSIKKYLVLLILIITAALTSVGYSAFVLSERVSNEDTQSGIASSSPVINIRYVNYIDETTSPVVTNTTKGNQNNETGYNTYLSHLNVPYEISRSSTTDTDGDLTIITTTYTIRNVTKCQLTNLIFYKRYTVEWTDTTYTYTRRYGDAIITENDVPINFYSYTIEKNTIFSRPNISRAGYSLVNFYELNSSNEFVLYDFSKPVSSNLNLYAKWVEIKSGTNTLTDFVKSANVESTIYSNPTSDNTYAITKDPSYSYDSLTVNLGNKDSITTISTTINFAMNTGLTNQEALDGQQISNTTASSNTGDKFVSLDYGGNTCDYTVVLQGDLIINGKLVIGGWTGSNSGAAEQGYIIKEYVTLDLNGHNITVNDGAVIHSFGLIKDSKGTGMITVKPGGTVYSQLVLFDLHGGNNTLWSYGKNFCPFNNYIIPYLRCKVRFEATETKTGNFYVFTKLNLGSLGFTNLYLPFIGTATEVFIFNFVSKSGNTGYVDYEYETIDNLKKSNPSSYENKNLLFDRNVFTFHNIVGNTDAGVTTGYLSVNASVISINKEFSINMDRVSFPISSFAYLYFKNSIFTVSQSLILQPGSIMEIDKDSVLNFDYYRNSSTGDKKSFSSIPVTYLGSTWKTLPGTSKYISGSIIATNSKPSNSNPFGALVGYMNNTNNYSTIFWNYFKNATCNVYGKINFVTGNNYPYKLSGNINISSFSIDGGETYSWDKNNLDRLSTVNLNTYAVEYNVSNSFWFNGDNLIGDSSNKGSYLNVNHFYESPLISNSIAYLYDDTFNLTGKYDEVNGVFSSDNGKKYVLLTSDFLVNYDYSGTTSSSASLQEADVDNSIIPSECVVESNYIIVNGQYYIFYGGNMFKATKTDATNCTATIIKFSTRIEGTNYEALMKNRSFTYNSSTSKWVANAIA